MQTMKAKGSNEGRTQPGTYRSCLRFRSAHRRADRRCRRNNRRRFHRKVTTDVHALYFGIELNDQTLTPGDNPRIGPTRFDDWLSRSIPQ